MNDDRVTYFAETDARNKRMRFGIKAKDRTRHVYIIGKTGMGKSTLLENMAVQDIQNGDGMAFIDPHGKTADLLLEYVPKERVRDVIYIAPFDTEFPISFNVLESVDPHKRHLVVSGLMSTFKKIWVDAWSARMEYILTNTLLALLEYPGATLLGVNKMLSDKQFRNEVISKITDPSVKSFWTKEFANYTERMAQEAVPAIQNKVGQFTANPLIRNMIGQSTSSFDFREAMDSRKIMIINLSKGKIGDENMKLLGGLLVTKLYLAAMSRADVPDRVMKNLPNFYLFVDEFQNFANASFADILSEARKYKLNLTIAHQYIEQMDETVRAAVFGNVGTMITFRVGATDAEALEKEYMPQFTTEDLVNLGFAQVYMKLMIDGLTSQPFSAVTMPPIPHPESSFIQDIIAASREQFAKPREEVEKQIVLFHEGPPKPPPKPIQPTFSNPPAPKALPAVPVDAARLPPKEPISAPKPAVGRPGPNGALSKSEAPASKTESARNGDRRDRPVPPPLPNTSLKSELEKLMKQKPAEQQSPRPIPAVPTEPVIKPLPLSALTPKAPQSRPDPKAQSPKNVADLKSALAAVLGAKAPAQPPQPPQPPHPVQPAQTTASEQKPPERPAPPQPPKNDSKEAPKDAQKPASEVPEDVLNKVLKVE